MNFLQRSGTTLFLLLALLSIRSPAFAGLTDSCARSFSEGISLHVSPDLDGDSKADASIARFWESSYRIELHFTTQRLRVRLNAPIRNEVGLELVAYDVDQDRRADLILTSASSVKPIAVWLNKGNGSFERSSASFGPLFATNDGPHFRRGASRSDVQAIAPTDDPADDLDLATNFI